LILIVSNKFDVHVDDAIRLLSAEGMEVFRLNTEDLLTKYRCEFAVDGAGSPRLLLIDELDRSVDLSALKVAWFRKPEYDFSFHSEYDADTLILLKSEAKAVIESIYSVPDITWVNDPFVASRAKVKLQQLLLARTMGMAIPSTLITNVPESAFQFYENCEKDLLMKAVYTGNSVSANLPQAIPSTRLVPIEFEEAYESIALLPTNLQRYIDKSFELRITVIGRQAFAVRIDSQLHEETKVDWRLYTDLNPHSIFELPSNIHKFCVEFVERQGLLFGAIDIIVRNDGSYVFLENNPFGQYLWLERMTGQPLTRAMCDLLCSLSE
jgi:glutathione synthase/RimK-type ligase-like ATP-grasp enzyme